MVLPKQKWGSTLAQKNSTTHPAFATKIDLEDDALVGPWRAPLQMLAEQTYGDHASIHDDATAQKLGFQGGTIEGPTHFSQFAPLAFEIWGDAWLKRGCLSAHYRAPVYEGEEVQARLLRPDGDTPATVQMVKADGSEVLQGSASIGPIYGTTELDRRLSVLLPLDRPVILEGVTPGARSQRQTVRMALDQNMGHLYPFSLKQKLEKITEPSPWYVSGEGSPYDRPIIPMEMISVLLNYTASNAAFYQRGPVVGLFADQEIRLIDGPLFVDEPYDIDREVVALSGSKRTESLWVLTRVYRPGTDTVIASMLLNQAVMKESYADYADDHKRLYGAV